MIASITGKVVDRGAAYIVLETNGIGYKLFVVPKIMEVPLDEVLTLHTYMQVREDAMNLFGFATASELAFFELLISVSGVGPKVALAVLSSGDMDLIKQAIITQDAAIFTRISGVGKKTAERIIVELKEKLGSASDLAVATNSSDILTALENLGYSNREIKEVLGKLDHALQPEEKLRQALKLLKK